MHIFGGSGELHGLFFLCYVVLCFALLTRAESDIMLALKLAISTLALARLHVQPADAVVVNEVFGGGGGCSVFHSKRIVEGKGKGASFILSNCLLCLAGKILTCLCEREQVHH